MKRALMFLIVACGPMDLPPSDFPIAVASPCRHRGLTVINDARWLTCSEVNLWEDKGPAP